MAMPRRHGHRLKTSMISIALLIKSCSAIFLTTPIVAAMSMIVFIERAQHDYARAYNMFCHPVKSQDHTDEDSKSRSITWTRTYTTSTDANLSDLQPFPVSRRTHSST